MLTTAILGLPRIGPRRELKAALEAHWNGAVSAADLEDTAAALRRSQLTAAATAGIDVLPSNDFSLYDHALDTAVLVGAVPERFTALDCTALERYFAMARGADGARPLQMTKWFDTNYHHLVPEIGRDTCFVLDADKPLRELREAQRLDMETRPVVLGPVSFLRLARPTEPGGDPLNELPRLLTVYEQLLETLHAAGAKAVQIDEPCLVQGLDEDELRAVERAWQTLASAAPGLGLTLATYFGGVGGALERVLRLPAREVHLDLVRAPEQLSAAIRAVDTDMRLSLGVVDGRNVWAADLDAIVRQARPAIDALGADRIRLAPSCSLLHVPYSAAGEQRLDGELRQWLAFGEEKLRELQLLKEAFSDAPTDWRQAFADHRRALSARRSSRLLHDDVVQVRLAALDGADHSRAPYERRASLQAERLGLPELPTTTIGSFPQTGDIRAARRRVAEGTLSAGAYVDFLRDEIRRTIARQEAVGLDVLVHGEPERNDMVQYFAERLHGFTVTDHGWVQSYGSRCVKPPLLFGDVSRPEPITVDWWRFAQGCTDRPVKAMLTGPVTLLNWSFVRDDQPRETTCRQLALAVADEAADLERAGAAIIQIDEAALREGLPLRTEDAGVYLRWAVDCFRLVTADLSDATQVHAHMCYSSFADVVDHIARMDADVVSIEASRSDMQLLDAFARTAYPNAVGPGVYDVHADHVPTVNELEVLLARAERHIPRDRLWVNPDCGLKTRGWEQVEPALRHLVQAARRRRTGAPTT